jgi:hypothetical protein
MTGEGMKLRAGDWIEVRSKDEILATLDSYGQLDRMPFMPQMFQYCGQRFKIYKSAHKTCDTVNPIRVLSIPDAVHLELRCDGEAFGGCQAACLLFWKTAWLKPVGALDGGTRSHLEAEEVKEVQIPSCSEQDVWRARYTSQSGKENKPSYRCQATQLPMYGTETRWWYLTQYWEDYTSGNVTLKQMFASLIFAGYYRLIQRAVGWGRPLRWLYDLFQFIRGGVPYPKRAGTIPVGHPTPNKTLNLLPGELIRIKSYKEILATLNTENRNRGLLFDAEMVPYCGGTYRVKDRVVNFVNEKTGELMTLQNPSIILEGVWCQSRYCGWRTFCPRSIYTWWREAWLDRISEDSQQAPQASSQVSSSRRTKAENLLS